MSDPDGRPVSNAWTGEKQPISVNDTPDKEFPVAAYSMIDDRKASEKTQHIAGIALRVTGREAVIRIAFPVDETEPVPNPDSEPLFAVVLAPPEVAIESYNFYHVLGMKWVRSLKYYRKTSLAGAFPVLLPHQVLVVLPWGTYMVELTKTESIFCIQPCGKGNAKKGVLCFEKGCEFDHQAYVRIVEETKLAEMPDGNDHSEVWYF